MDVTWVLWGGVAAIFVLIELYFLAARFSPNHPLWKTKFHRKMVKHVGPANLDRKER